VREAGREFTGRHGARSGVQHLEDVPSGVVRESAEDCVEFIEIT